METDLSNVLPLQVVPIYPIPGRQYLISDHTRPEDTRERPITAPVSRLHFGTTWKMATGSKGGWSVKVLREPSRRDRE